MSKFDEGSARFPILDFAARSDFAPPERTSPHESSGVKGRRHGGYAADVRKVPAAARLRQPVPWPHCLEAPQSPKVRRQDRTQTLQTR